MSESRQKFEYLSPEDHNKKAIRVDEIAAAKDNVQEAAKALAEGKMPTTGQITEAIDSLKDSQPLRSGVELSATGHRVSTKTDQALDSVKQLVSEKNADNEIQKLIHHAKLAARNLEADGVNYSAEKQSSEKNLQRAYSNLVVLSRLIVTSSEFRGLLADLYNFVRDVLRNNDIPYAENLPHSDQVTRKDGSIDVGKAKESATTAAEKAKSDAYSKLDKDSQQKLEQAKGGNHKKPAKDLADQAAQKLSQAAKPIVDKAAQGNTQEAKEHLLGKYEDTSSEARKMASQAQRDGKDALNQASSKLDNVAQDLKLSEEQQELLADRFASILDELQSNPEAQKAIDGLMEVLSNLRRNANTVAQRAKETAGREVDENRDLREAAKNAKRAVENFAGQHSLDRLFQLLHDFSEKVENDKELNELLRENRQFFNKEFSDAAGKHFNRTRDILLSKYREHINCLSDEAQSFITDLKEDPTTNRAVRDLENLTRELFLDADGRPTIKFDLLQDFQKFIPVLSRRLECLEIPRICAQDDDTEYILDNITLVCSNIVPKTVRVRTDTEFDTEQEKIMNVVSVKIQGVQAAAREVAFYFKKKVTILGNMEDAGMVDVAIDGDGMDVFLKLAPKTISTSSTSGTDVGFNLGTGVVTGASTLPGASAGAAPVYATVPGAGERAFRVLESKCRVNSIHVKFQYTKYDLLYKVFNKLIQSTIKRQIETQVSEGIRTFLEGIEHSVSSQNQPIDASQPSKPLDPRPDGWKSEAFGAQP
ncbi:hypothetical protein L0F63_005234 [Massospora cicadina]|nr:hypothetical protein L0F63_005234 [Massospora cicadina]